MWEKNENKQKIGRVWPIFKKKLSAQSFFHFYAEKQYFAATDIGPRRVPYTNQTGVGNERSTNLATTTARDRELFYRKSRQW